MGGLDARALAHIPEMAGKIASITTISTPHTGSRIPDMVLGLADGDHAGAILALGSIYGQVAAGHLEDEDVRAGLYGCSEQRMPSFNAENPDVPGIFYQ